MMNYAVRNRAADSIGEIQVSGLADQIVEDDLRKKFGDKLGGPPAASQWH